MSDEILLDEIKKSFGLKTDNELAGLLGVTKSAIQECRYGKDRRLGLLARFKLLDTIAYLRTTQMAGQWISAVGSPSLAKRLMDGCNEIARTRVAKYYPENEESVSDSVLIEVAKVALECHTDAELSAILGITRPSVSSIRSGRSALGIEPRLALLSRIEGWDLNHVMSLLKSSQALIEAIRNWKALQGQAA